jgi:hypothetical protein
MSVRKTSTLSTVLRATCTTDLSVKTQKNLVIVVGTHVSSAHRYIEVGLGCIQRQQDLVTEIGKYICTPGILAAEFSGSP